MTQILVVAGDPALRCRLAASLRSMDRPIIALSNRNDAAALIDATERQVMIYAPSYGGDVGWVAEALEHHPGLRVVYLSPTPWVSLAYGRARCIIAPPVAAALDVGLLRRVASEMLAVGSRQKTQA